jgi:hypothetical protein
LRLDGDRIRVDGGERRQGDTDGPLFQRLVDLLHHDLRDRIGPAPVHQLRGPPQDVQRHIGGDRHRPCHRDIAPRAEARIQGGAQPAHLGALRIGLREDIFVDEALSRQG